MNFGSNSGVSGLHSIVERWKQRGGSIMWLIEDFKMWTKYSDIYVKEKIWKVTGYGTKKVNTKFKMLVNWFVNSFRKKYCSLIKNAHLLLLAQILVYRAKLYWIECPPQSKLCMTIRAHLWSFEKHSHKCYVNLHIILHQTLSLV